jgi:hypothetical protein
MEKRNRKREVQNLHLKCEICQVCEFNIPQNASKQRWSQTCFPHHEESMQLQREPLFSIANSAASDCVVAGVNRPLTAGYPVCAGRSDFRSTMHGGFSQRKL